MNDYVIENQLAHTISQTTLANVGERYQGKVRDTYSVGDRLVLVATDRISAFDHILRQTIPFKGQVLNQIAAYFFKATADIVPNHFIALPDPNVTVAYKCDPIPVEFVVRGYLAGHAWRTYKSGQRTLCGVPLPEGLRQNSKLPEPILTPATKAIQGHDEDISREEILTQDILSEDVFDQLKSWALSLFRRGTEMAQERGLILVDTKYEFGKTASGEYIVIDEIHTPDSSRFFYRDTYPSLLKEDKPQRQLSKEFVREWLIEHDFMGLEGQHLPDLPDSFRVEISKRYIELYEVITGVPFAPDTSMKPVQRLEKNLLRYLHMQ